MKVFLSYNHQDAEFVKRIKAALEAEEIGVRIDYEVVEFGENLRQFQDDSVRITDLTLCVISRHSLQSMWVIAEALETFMYEKTQARRKFVPIFIDRSFFDYTFQAEIVEATEKSIAMISDEIYALSKKFLPTSALDLQKSRLAELRYNIDTVLRRLRESLVGDFSSEEKFQENFSKLVQQIKNYAPQAIRKEEDPAPAPAKPEATPFMQFVNRKVEWERVVLYPTGPYFIFDAPAGYGKTALLQEIRRQFSRRPWRCVSMSLKEQTTIPAIAEYFRHELQNDSLHQTANPFLLGSEIGRALAKQREQTPVEGVALLFDLDQEPWDALLKTLQTLVEAVIPGIYQGLTQTSPYFKLTQDSFRVVLAGRYLTAQLDRFSASLKFESIRLTPFTYKVALAMCRERIADADACHEFAANLLFFSGGHPRCMARILEKFQAEDVLPSLFFNLYRQQIEHLAYQEAFWVRESIGRTWRLLFDRLCVYRRFDSQLLDRFLDAHPDWTALAEDGFDLAMQLKRSYLIAWADPYRKHLCDDITRRLLVARLEHDLPPEIFTRRCRQVETLCLERMRQADFDRSCWALEALFAFLQQHRSHLQDRAARMELHRKFYEHTLPELLHIFFAGRQAQQEKISFLGFLEQDHNFRFLLNYALRDAHYTDAPYKKMLSCVEQYLPQPTSGGKHDDD